MKRIKDDQIGQELPRDAKRSISSEVKEREIFRSKIRRGDRDLFLSIEDVASRFGVGTKTIRKLIAARKLPAGKIGGKWRVYVDDLFDFYRRSCMLQDEKSRTSASE